MYQERDYLTLMYLKYLNIIINLIMGIIHVIHINLNTDYQVNHQTYYSYRITRYLKNPQGFTN